MADLKISELVKKDKVVGDDIFTIVDSQEPSPLKNKQVKASTLKTYIKYNTVLNDITDVSITEPTENQILKFDGTKWVNGELSVDWANINNAPTGVSYFENDAGYVATGTIDEVIEVINGNH